MGSVVNEVVNDHIDGHYELHLLIFKMSNGSSYYEAYKKLLTPYVSCVPTKRKKLSSFHSLSLFLSFSQHFSLISSPLYIYIIKVIHSHPYFYLSHIYSHFTTKNNFIDLYSIKVKDILNLINCQKIRVCWITVLIFENCSLIFYETKICLKI